MPEAEWPCEERESATYVAVNIDETVLNIAGRIIVIVYMVGPAK